MVEGQEGVTWDDWVALARATEELGFEALFRFGPLRPGRRRAGARLARRVDDARRPGRDHLADSARHARLTGNLQASVGPGEIRGDGGPRIGRARRARHGRRVERGGARALRLSLPAHERADGQIAEQLEIEHRQLTLEPFSFEGEHYRLEDANPQPKPVQSPHLPLIVGGRGRPRSVALAARWADEYNTVSPTPDECRALRQRIAEACEREGSYPLPLSVMTCSDPAHRTRRSGG